MCGLPVFACLMDENPRTPKREAFLERSGKSGEAGCAATGSPGFESPLEHQKTEPPDRVVLFFGIQKKGDSKGAVLENVPVARFPRDLPARRRASPRWSKQHVFPATCPPADGRYVRLRKRKGNAAFSVKPNLCKRAQRVAVPAGANNTFSPCPFPPQSETPCGKTHIAV